MAKRIYKRMPKEFRDQVNREIETIEREEMDEIMAMGRNIRARHERLARTLQALKAEREAQGVSLTEMEKRTGISKSALSRLENEPNANPTVSTLMRIAEALGREITIQITNPKEAA
jgi:DNA-binding phage protein